jgi:hypothetical protein
MTTKSSSRTELQSHDIEKGERDSMSVGLSTEGRSSVSFARRNNEVRGPSMLHGDSDHPKLETFHWN